MAIPDPTEEIKAIRHRLGAALDYDLGRIVADLKRQQAESGRKYISLPPRKLAGRQLEEKNQPIPNAASPLATG